MARLEFVLGGARSGKSSFAQARAEATGLEPVMLATAAAGDSEMADRIARHRAERGPRWTTVEEPRDLAAALAAATAPDRIVVVDCLTLWLSNVTFSGPDHAEAEGAAIDAAVTALADGLAGRRGPVILVSNELGLGLVPENALSRGFRDRHGRMNQAVAARADAVAFLVAGLPMWLKGG